MIPNWCARRLPIALIAAILLAVLTTDASQAPSLSKLDRNRLKQMLEGIGAELKRSYYDPTFGGRDLDAHLAAAQTRLDAATSLNQGFALIAQALVELEDSHTFFIPPARTATIDYGWRLQMVGERCYIVGVGRDSDAAAQGLSPGDEVVSVDGFFPSREELWKLEYALYVLRPRTAVTLVVRPPGQPQRQVTVKAAVVEGKRLIDLTRGDEIDALVRQAQAQAPEHQVARLKSVVVWKLPTFAFADAERVLDRTLADAQDLILDLRGNRGGRVVILEQIAGRLFDRDVVIAEVKGRQPEPPLRGRKGPRAFTGRVVVLIDGNSGSASELLARVLQLERRGTVLGDRSSGSVRRSHRFRDALGLGTVVFYGASITDGDLIMSDGKSLERVGVVPDELVLPTAADLAAGRDPALARATELLGVRLTPELAGMLFPAGRR